MSLLLLQACQHRKNTQPNSNLGASELFDLSAQNSYQLTGKISFSDGQEGGSGRIIWQNNQGLINIQLKAPLSSKSWNLAELVDGAELIAYGSVVNADSAQTLISNQLGWEVPWQQLKSWVNGKPHDASKSELNWQSDGFSLTEGGWQIEYSRMKTVKNNATDQPILQLPHKMVARKGGYSIKLSIKQWILD